MKCVFCSFSDTNRSTRCVGKFSYVKSLQFVIINKNQLHLKKMQAANKQTEMKREQIVREVTYLPWDTINVAQVLSRSTNSHKLNPVDSKRKQYPNDCPFKKLNAPKLTTTEQIYYIQQN